MSSLDIGRIQSLCLSRYITGQPCVEAIEQQRGYHIEQELRPDDQGIYEQAVADEVNYEFIMDLFNDNHCLAFSPVGPHECQEADTPELVRRQVTQVLALTDKGSDPFMILSPMAVSFFQSCMTDIYNYYVPLEECPVPKVGAVVYHGNNIPLYVYDFFRVGNDSLAYYDGLTTDVGIVGYIDSEGEIRAQAFSIGFDPHEN